MARTKIICTLGPSSKPEKVLKNMALAGMDILRFNFSHGRKDEFEKAIFLVRKINEIYKRKIKILGDLEGHRIRVGNLKVPVSLKMNEIVYLTQRKAEEKKRIIPFDYRGNLEDIKVGQNIFIDDGNIALEVMGFKKGMLKTKVFVCGVLKERKGINIPGAKLKFGKLTEKDKKDIEFCIENRFDLIAQSFVETKDDIEIIREMTRVKLPHCKLVAKIESREGVKNIGEIIKVSDWIMIARGDMGVSLPIYEVPSIQKEIIKKCNRAGKPVITATQMLESMIENRIPTRAEVSDVANAIIDGSDYLMLSGETAIGCYPALTVKMMDQIIKFTEKKLG